MNTATPPTPSRVAILPEAMASAPSEGSTPRSSLTSKGAAKGFSREVANSKASLSVKDPVI